MQYLNNKSNIFIEQYLYDEGIFALPRNTTSICFSMGLSRILFYWTNNSIKMTQHKKEFIDTRNIPFLFLFS